MIYKYNSICEWLDFYEIVNMIGRIDVWSVARVARVRSDSVDVPYMHGVFHHRDTGVSHTDDVIIHSIVCA